jgi:hypothetical protein
VIGVTFTDATVSLSSCWNCAARRAKVIPAPSTLAEAFTAFRRGAAAQAALKAEMARLNAEPVEVPADLEKRVRDHLAENREETWDAALRAITGLEGDEDDLDEGLGGSDDGLDGDDD